MNTQLLIIGAGPGGYTAAFAAAQAGCSVTLVDSQNNLGGVCLNRGCIPSKALLHCAKLLNHTKSAEQLGLYFTDPRIDFDQLRNWKDGIINRLASGLNRLVKKHQVTFIQAQAQLKNANTATLTKADGETIEVVFEHAIIATGSSPVKLKDQPDTNAIISSTEALRLESIPKTLLIVGGGYIGLEMASIYAAFGSCVTVVEAAPSLLNGVDADCLRILNRSLKKKMHNILTEATVQNINPIDNGVEVTIQGPKDKPITEPFDKVLVAVGRKPNTQNIGLENTQVALDDKGFINVQPNRQTDDPSIYAIGDVTAGPMLAHKASAEAHVAVDALLGKKTAFAPKAIPAVVYTDPEIATCGLSEEQAKAEGKKIQVASLNWIASGRALTMDRKDGLAKLIVDAKSRKILGVSLVGPEAGELIAQGVLAVENGLTVEDIKKTIHPHPTLSETLLDALLNLP